MFNINKPVAFSLLFAFSFLSVSPAEAGYYKTVYVEDGMPQTNIVINNYETQSRIVEKHVPVFNYQENPALTALGIGAVVGGIILGVASHNHHKKIHHKKPLHFPKKRHHGRR